MTERGHASARDARIAVAVVSWNTRELLSRCLDSLADDAAAGRADVWVVDNGSTDGSRELVAERYRWTTLVTPPENLGYGPAVNLVAQRTDTPWLVAANADVWLERDALARLRTCAASDDRVAMVGPRLLLLDGSTQISVRPFPSVVSALLLLTQAMRVSARARRALRMAGAWEPAPGEAVPWLTGAFVLMRRRAFEEVGGFDPAQWLYGEDMDLCWRLRERGWLIRWEPDAIAHHAHSAAAGQAFHDNALLLHIAVAQYLWMLRRRGELATRTAALAGTLDATLQLLASVRRGYGPRARSRGARVRAELRGQMLGLAPRARLELLVDARRRGA
jgi:N-acetylglucosaminyl-diphospho-decaprenol L-rhamnosyltransferase